VDHVHRTRDEAARGSVRRYLSIDGHCGKRAKREPTSTVAGPWRAGSVRGGRGWRCAAASSSRSGAMRGSASVRSPRPRESPRGRAGHDGRFGGQAPRRLGRLGPAARVPGLGVVVGSLRTVRSPSLPPKPNRCSVPIQPRTSVRVNGSSTGRL
jgi:hypothetical protein